MTTLDIAPLNPTTYTLAQLHTLSRLARAYDHAWGTQRIWQAGDGRLFVRESGDPANVAYLPLVVPPGAHSTLGATVDAASLVALLSERCAYPLATHISPPLPDRLGIARHATGTGRTVWEAYPDGAANIWITRPQGDALFARVPYAAGAGEGDPLICEPAVSAADVAAGQVALPYGERHIAAMFDALVPLCGAWRAHRAVLPLHAGIAPDA